MSYLEPGSQMRSAEQTRFSITTLFGARNGSQSVQGLRWVIKMRLEICRLQIAGLAMSGNDSFQQN